MLSKKGVVKNAAAKFNVSDECNTDDDLTHMHKMPESLPAEASSKSAQQNRRSRGRDVNLKKSDKTLSKKGVVKDVASKLNVPDECNTDDDFSEIPPSEITAFDRPVMKFRRSWREGFSAYRAKNNWIDQTADNYMNLLKKTEIGDTLKDYDWCIAQFIFCMDADVQDDVIVQHDGLFLTREMVRCFEGQLWISNHPVDVFCKYLNAFETENMRADNQRRNLYLPCAFSYNLWTNFRKLKSACNDTIKKYLSKQFDMPFCNPATVYNRIFIPHCINNHWGLHVIDIQRREIIELNSANRRPHSNNDSKFTQVMLNYLGALLYRYDVPYKIRNFKIVRGECCQQPENGWDCGVLMLKMMTSHTDGVFPNLTLSHCPIYRVELAIKLVVCHLNEVIGEVVRDLKKAYPEKDSDHAVKFSGYSANE